MRLLPLFIFLCFLTSCRYLPEWLAPLPPWESAPKESPAIHSEEATRIVQEFSVDMEHKKNLHLERAKTCFDEEGIKTVQLDFISQDLIELCEARKLIVDLTENLLERLNQDIILGPEFASFPLRPENLELYITYESYFGQYVDPIYIYWICLEDGVVNFYTWELEYDPNQCWHCKKEAYATSREIVVYQREAEQKYQEEHAPPPSIFGSERYYPPNES
jgi:hypothetical protein